MRIIILTAIALTTFLASIPGFAAKNAVKRDSNDPLPNKIQAKDKEKEESSYSKEIGGKNLDLWMKDLKTTDPGVYENAIRTIGLFGPRAKTAIPIVIAKLKSPYAYKLDVSVKVNSAIFLGACGLGDEAQEEALEGAVKGLNSLLDDSQAIVRFHAAIALGRIGRAVTHTGAQGKRALQKLTSNLKNTSTWEIRKACAAALATVGVPEKEEKGPDPVVIDELRKRLTSLENCAQVRMEAAQTLMMLGPPAEGEVRSRLIQTLIKVANNKKEDTTVRIWANVGLMRSEGVKDDRLAFIGKLLDHEILGVRCQAARALGMIGPEAKSQLPRLKKALQDDNGIMLSWVFFALGNMGPSARGAISSLKDLKKKAAEKKNKGLEKAIEDLIKAIQEAKPVKEKKDEKKKPPRKKPKKGKKAPRGDRFDE
jgi:HEAT repeat protein